MLFVLERKALASLFIDSASLDAKAVLAATGPLIVVAGTFQLFDALQAIGAGLARGLKDSVVPMLLAIASYWGVGFGAALLLGFPLGLGGVGIWLGFLVGLAAAAVSLNARFFSISARIH